MACAEMTAMMESPKACPNCATVLKTAPASDCICAGNILVVRTVATTKSTVKSVC